MRTTFFLSAFALLTAGCGPKRYEAHDASKLAMEHARGPNRAEIMTKGAACDTQRDAVACAEVARAMEDAGERNDAISLYDHACELGHMPPAPRGRA